MTEQEWLACGETTRMLAYLQGKASERKLRLFAVACCRRVWPLLSDKRGRRAVEANEKYADQLIGTGSLQKIGYEAKRAIRSASGTAIWAHRAASLAIDSIGSSPTLIGSAILTADAARLAAHDAGAEPIIQAQLIRCIFGNPFHSATVDPNWFTSTVTSLAQGIYEEHAFDRLPILADALEDAGCDNADILNHCRQPDEHIRGCWAVDLILGKK